MTKSVNLLELRSNSWSGIPKVPGVYWWYCPLDMLKDLGLAQKADVSKLQLRQDHEGNVCVYHGLAKNLYQRVKWHAAQKLTLSALRSGTLSSFRFTLLALNDFDYLTGEVQINNFIDNLSFSWQTTDTREKAEQLEETELQGKYHYPLNTKGNKRPELEEFVRFMVKKRQTYRSRNI